SWIAKKKVICVLLKKIDCLASRIQRCSATSDLLIFTLPGKATSNVKMATPLSPPSVKKQEKRKLRDGTWPPFFYDDVAEGVEQNLW
ncbi:MAG: hypothetical protein WA183_00940, partial [Chthoniobacterales bacterium]